MHVSAESRLGVGALLALQFLTSFAAIGLLARISPAVERILRENVYSEEAVEEMVSVLAEEHVAGTRERERFSAALQRAHNNVTEDEERPLLDAIEADANAALGGDRDARKRVITQARKVSDVNRRSMRRADESARLLGLTGAWAAALMGLTGFVVGVVVYRRLRWRIVVPVMELDAALSAYREGDGLRRCVNLGGPMETHRLTENLNWLMDKLSARPVVTVRPSPTALTDHASLLMLLDRLPHPTGLVASGGEVMALNRAALESGSAEASAAVRAVAHKLVNDEAVPEEWTVTPVAEGGGWLCERLPDPLEADPDATVS